MSNVCQICDYKTNLTTRKSISCPFCSFDVCRTCCETYVTNEALIKCMNPSCGREWTRQFSRTAFTATFLNKKYKEVREQTLFDQERALLPATQPIVENMIRVENVRTQMADVNRQIRELYERQRELQGELYAGQRANVTTTSERHEFIKSCPDGNCRGFLSSQWKCGICEKWACHACHEIKGDTRDADHTCNPETVATVALLQNDTRPCPKCRTGIFKIDGCFAKDTPVLMWDGSKKMSQDIIVGDVLIGDDGCQRVVERLVSGEDSLYEIKQSNGMNYTVNSKHTMVLKNYENDIDIVVDEFLKLNPAIQRQFVGFKNIGETSEIEVVGKGRGQYFGWSVNENKRFLLTDFTVVRNCDQMWCTQCHTAFNWRNGRIENVVHNPHYFEWLRRNGNDVPRNPGDIPCRNELNHNDFRDIRNIMVTRHKDHPLSNACLNFLQQAIQNAIHLRWVIQDRYRQVDYVERNQSLRVSYMRNQITEEQFKISLQRNEKKNEKSREVRNVLDILFTTVSDIIFRFRAHLNTAPANKWEGTILEELDVIVDYVNECLADISHTYTSKKIVFYNDIRMR